MKFLIFSPPYRNSSAGIRVLHRLAQELIKLGYRSFVFTDWRETARLRPYVGDCVVVYPEVIRGNPLGAKNVVRYVLNTPGYLGCDSTYADSELVFVHSRALMAGAQSATRQVIDESRLMEISVIEPWLFQPKPELERAYDVCFWVGKGANVADNETMTRVNDYIRGKKFLQITYELPSTREGLAHLFQSCHEFLTIDDFTAMLMEAKLCGCKTTIMRRHGPEDYAEDVSRFSTSWYDTAAIGNFANICRETFERCEAAA